MPFDGTLPETDARLALFAERRRACAELWRGVPVEKFNMTYWGDSKSCGTTACALGWLAMHNQDGWVMVDDRPLWRTTDDNPFDSAKAYLAITHTEATSLFGLRPSFYGMQTLREVTSAMVADRLLALPYTLAD